MLNPALVDTCVTAFPAPMAVAKPQELRPVAIDRMRRRLPRPRSAEPHLRVFSVPRGNAIAVVSLVLFVRNTSTTCFDNPVDEFEKTVTYSKRLQVFDRPESRNPYRPPKPKRKNHSQYPDL